MGQHRLPQQQNIPFSPASLAQMDQQQQQQQQHPHPHSHQQQQQQHHHHPFSAPSSSGLDLGLGLPKDLQNMSDQELSALLSQKDIASSLAEDLLAQLESGDKDDISNASLSSQSGTITSQDGGGMNLNILDVKNERLDHHHHHHHHNKSASLFNELKIDTSLQPGVSSVDEDNLPSPRLDISMSASNILEACKGYGVHGTWTWNMLSDKAPPMPPSKPYPALSKDKLYPPTPSVYVSSFGIDLFCEGDSTHYLILLMLWASHLGISNQFASLLRISFEFVKVKEFSETRLWFVAPNCLFRRLTAGNRL